MSHPFEHWPRRRRRGLLIAASAGALTPSALALLVRPLREDEPGGASIVDFELAGSVERAREIVATWRAQGVLDDAKAIQLFDVIYPLVYAAALAGACVAAAGAWRRLGRPRLGAAGIALAWVAFAAAAFDYVENVGLAVSLWDVPASPWPQVALACALAKFAAILVTLLFGLSGAVAAVVAGRHRR